MTSSSLQHNFIEVIFLPEIDVGISLKNTYWIVFFDHNSQRT